MIKLFNYPFSIHFEELELDRTTIFNLTEFLRLFPIIVGEEEIKVIEQIENEFDDENDKRKFTKAYYKATIYAKKYFLQRECLTLQFENELSFLFVKGRNEYDEGERFKKIQEIIHKSEMFYFLKDGNKFDIENFKKYRCGYF